MCKKSSHYRCTKRWNRQDQLSQLVFMEKLGKRNWMGAYFIASGNTYGFRKNPSITGKVLNMNAPKLLFRVPSPGSIGGQ
uniref:Uncharacterized protein n=1 Tax=Picea glauca TaxID=3330 RepID=A0A101M4U9_PICGL|nr:hypothetical protein ABT39_MTgene967 [Picea glauca]